MILNLNQYCEIRENICTNNNQMSYHQEKKFYPFRKTNRTPQKFRGRLISPDLSSPENDEEKYKTSSFAQQSNGSPSFQKSSSNKYYDSPQSSQQPIWQKLYKHGLSTKKIHLQKHQENKQKQDHECTFQPQIKHSKKYLLNSQSSFLQRVQIWQDHKIQKLIKEKEGEVNKDLKQCTFIPKINQKSKKIQQFREENIVEKLHLSPGKDREKFVKQEQQRQTFQQQQRKKLNFTLNSQKKPKNFAHIQQVKAMIRIQLRRINL